MNIDISKYNSFIFDCDGVILNSNALKTQAFYKTALPYGISAAKKLVDYHLENGGISRYKKFAWFLDKVVANQPGPNLEQLLLNYAKEVKNGLLTCNIADGLIELRQKTKHANWLIVSGSDQKELRDIFAVREITKFFDGGIFGSPDNKNQILAREKANGNIREPALFLGDSKYDHEAATDAKLNFVFISYWTEFSDWKNYCKSHNIYALHSLNIESIVK